ncbi:hypothetical protein EI94DRAFT_439782 [Lactarius quietus]|nr:hypothetical protein EI94DRAFT_439782 [Lactarius quietus]
MQDGPSELRVEVTGMRLYPVFPEGGPISFLVVGVDNLPYIRRWLRTKKRFLVTVTYQETTVKLANAKFDGRTPVRWNKKSDVFLVKPPPSPFTLRLYAKRFLHRNILVGQTQEILPPVGSTNDLSYYLSKEQASQSTQPVRLRLKITVSENAASTPRSPTSPSNPIMQDVRPPAPVVPPSPTNLMMPTARPVQRLPSGSGNSIAAHTPSSSSSHSRANFAVNPAPSDPSLHPSSANFPDHAPSTSRVSANPTYPVAAHATPPLILPVAVNGASSSTMPSNPADRTAVKPRSDRGPRSHTNASNSYSSKARQPDPSTSKSSGSEPGIGSFTRSAERPTTKSSPANHTNLITPNPIPVNTADSRAHQSDPFASNIPEFEPDIQDIIQTVQRSVHQSKALSFLLT